MNHQKGEQKGVLEGEQKGDLEGEQKGDLEGEQGLASPGGGIVEQAIAANLRGLGYGG